MATPVSLKEVVQEMDVLIDDGRAYLNRRTGELFTAMRELLSAVEDGDDEDDAFPDWQQADLAKAREVIDSDDWLALPSKFDIHEYHIMEEFCLGVADETLREDLLDAIRGEGAFRRFKGMIHRHGLQDDWYRFREEALTAIAVQWLEAHAIRYVK